MKIRRILISGMALLTVVAALSCGGASTPATDVVPSPAVDPPAAEEPGALPSGHPTMEARSLSEITAEAAPETGTVQELLEGGGYTYARVKAGEREMWIAGPVTRLEVGQEIGITGAVSMGRFSSPSLERTFDELFFVGAFQPAGPPPGATRGEVVEVLEGGGYTYVLARVGDGQRWLAGPMVRVAQGDTVLWSGGMDMGEFHSPSLDRTFESLFFVGRFWVESR